MYLRRGRLVAVTGNGDPEAVQAMPVTSGVFRALRVTPSLGRIFTREDEDPDAPPIVLLSHGFWQSRYAGDRGVIGKTLQVDGATREIVGVMPPILRGLGADPALFMLMTFRRENLFVGNIGFDALARLREGVTIGASLYRPHTDVTHGLGEIPGRSGGELPSNRKHYAPVIQPLQDDLVGSAADILWVLMGGVGLILLIACANVANLFLVRAEGKETEMAVRTAMGASGRRIGWEYLKESLLLGVLGGIAGLALAQIGLDVLKTMGAAQLPRLEEVALSPDGPSVHVVHLTRYRSVLRDVPHPEAPSKGGRRRAETRRPERLDGRPPA